MIMDSFWAQQDAKREVINTLFNYVSRKTFTVCYPKYLTEWEINFLNSVGQQFSKKFFISPKQANIIKAINENAQRRKK